MFHVGCSCDRVHRRFLGFGDFSDLPLHGFFVKLNQIHHVSFIFFTNVMTFLKSCNHSSSFLHKNDVYVRQGDSQKKAICLPPLRSNFLLHRDAAIFSSRRSNIFLGREQNLLPNWLHIGKDTHLYTTKHRFLHTKTMLFMA